MPLDKSALLEFLEILNGEISRKITLVAAGGTAMTLLNLKPSTIDIDLTIPDNDKPVFDEALASVPHGFKIHAWSGGFVFSQILPDDYLEKSIEIADFEHILLKALHPVDVVVTKIGRLDERDVQDIEACIKGYNISRDQIRNRAAAIHYIGDEEVYHSNLEYVLERFFNNAP